MHSPEHTAVELAEKLIARYRHVVLLVGAGASRAAGLPDIGELKTEVATRLENTDKAAFERLSPDRNIEQILTRLRLISAVLSGSGDEHDGFTEETATKLDRRICSEIARTIQGRAADYSAHHRLATWVGLSRYDRPIEIFTTNYDVLLERGLELAAIPYFDGFVGHNEARFRADLVDSAEDSLAPPVRWARLWKLHGSVSWSRLEDGSGSIVRSAPDPEKALAIYPSLQKYEESRRIPFVVLADRFRRSLSTPETLCLVIGYSFRDDHINEQLYDAARLHPASEVLALNYETPPDEVLERATTIPNLTLIGPKSAVIGAQLDPWASHSEDTSFWQADAFTLGEFSTLSRFLLLNMRSSGTPPGSEALEL